MICLVMVSYAWGGGGGGNWNPWGGICPPPGLNPDILYMTCFVTIYSTLYMTLLFIVTRFHKGFFVREGKESIMQTHCSLRVWGASGGLWVPRRLIAEMLLHFEIQGEGDIPV